MRFCDHSFCIYQEKGRCILKKISLDEMGLCRECILLDLPESEKKASKNGCAWNLRRDEKAPFD